jgi:alpha-galactosidase
VAPWGSSRAEIPDEVLLHNLEHGGIWISHKNPSDTALVEKLEALASRYRSKVIVTPRSRNESPIAIAAWERLLKLDTYDEDRIVEFINAFRNKGPERVPD